MTFRNLAIKVNTHTTQGAGTQPPSLEPPLQSPRMAPPGPGDCTGHPESLPTAGRNSMGQSSQTQWLRASSGGRSQVVVHRGKSQVIVKTAAKQCYCMYTKSLTVPSFNLHSDLLKELLFSILWDVESA